MKALEGVRALDLSDGVAGQFCGRLLQDYGADVCLVEQPTGTTVRRMGPFRPRTVAESALFAHLNHGKRSITLDWTTPSGWELLLRMLRDVDVLIVGPGFDSATVRSVFPRCTVVSISDFGDDGEFQHWRGTEIVHQALSGVMYENGKVGKVPLYGCGYRSYYAAGVVAYISLLSALFAMERVGDGQSTTVEVGITASSMNYCRATQYGYSGIYDRRGGTKRPMAFVRASDGWMCLFPNDRSWEGVCQELGAEELLRDAGLRSPLERQRRWKDIVDVFQEKVRDRSADEVVAAVQRRGGVAGREYKLDELARSEHLAQRDYWDDVGDGDERIPILGPLFRMSETPRTLSGGPPVIGENNVAEYRRIGVDEKDLGALRHAGIV